MKSVLLVAQALAPIHHSHAHTEWEIGICHSGELVFASGDTVHELKTGGAYICPPGIEHNPLTEENDEYEVTIIKYVDTDARRQRAKGLITANDRGSAISKLFSIVEWLWQNDGERSAKVLSHLVGAIVHLIVGDSKPDRCTSSVAILRERIETKYADIEFRIPNAITELGYNADYLRRLFKAEVGVSPSEYLTDIRIEKAKLLLSEPSPLSIAQIAIACGFYDANYFTRLFKQKVGTVPSDFRKST